MVVRADVPPALELRAVGLAPVDRRAVAKQLRVVDLVVAVVSEQEWLGRHERSRARELVFSRSTRGGSFSVVGLERVA